MNSNQILNLTLSTFRFSRFYSCIYFFVHDFKFERLFGTSDCERKEFPIHEQNEIKKINFRTDEEFEYKIETGKRQMMKIFNIEHEHVNES